MWAPTVAPFSKIAIEIEGFLIEKDELQRLLLLTQRASASMIDTSKFH